MKMSDLPIFRVTQDDQETMAIAAEFACFSQAGDIILLSGPLGAGKTQFVRGYCEGLGMSEIWEVDSPTYTVVNHYEVASGVDHIDLYRLNGPADLDEIDFEELLASASVKLIEWPEHLPSIQQPTYLVRLEVLSHEERSLTIARL